MIASDVDHPLTGPNGAAATFGPQKGASAEQVRHLERAVEHVAALAGRSFGDHLAVTPGAGAAGGVSYALLLLGGRLVPPSPDRACSYAHQHPVAAGSQADS